MWNSLAAFTSPTMFMGEDFNCVLTNTDCNGIINFSKVLDKLAHGFGVVDVWENVPPQNRMYILHLARSDMP